MAPKKKQVMLVDGVDTSAMARDKLEAFVMRLKDELDKEREERNFFQLERDKIRTFWEITRKQLDEAKAELRNRERTAEEVQEENAQILETEKQRFKHLQYEQQVASAAMRAENLVSLKAAKEEYAEMENELLNDKRNLKVDMRELMSAALDELRRAKLKHAENLSKTREDFEEKARMIEDKAEKKLTETKEQLNEKHRMEIESCEERKNKQISDMVDSHAKAFLELKNYYNDITLNNLGLISNLKIKLEETQKLKERAEKIARDAVNEVKNLKEPLEHKLAENIELKRQLANYDRDKALLKAKSKQLNILTKQYDVLKWEYEVVLVRLERILMERDELKCRFSRAVLEVQEKASLKAVLLEEKLRKAEGYTLTPQQMAELQKLKDNQIEDLHYDAARLRKAHNDLLATYETKLLMLGIKKEELGFKPLRAADFDSIKNSVVSQDGKNN